MRFLLSLVVPVVLLIIVLSIIVIPSCGRESPTGPPAAAGISISPAAAELDAIGATVQFTASVRDGNDRVIADAVVTWTSGNPEVASVTDTGLVTARKNGTAVVTAATGVFSANATVTVSQAVARIEVAPASVTFTKTDRALRVDAVAKDRNGNPVPNARLFWTSSDPFVVSVNALGDLEAWSNGNAWITVSTGETSTGVDVTVSGFGPDALDRAVLMALFNGTGGPGWTLSTNWSSDAPLAEWQGVTTDAEGRVIELLLDRNGLTGAFPAELVRLEKLQSLSLLGNRLTGSIPPGIGSLANLELLEVSYNRLTGSIPPEIGRLVRLREFGARGNNFSHGPLPRAMANLDNLERLRLDRTFLCAPLDAVFQAWLGAIAYVEVDNCEDLERSALVALYNAADGRNWTGQHNWLTGAPLSAWHGVATNDMGQVTGLDLAGNNLKGTLPSRLGDLRSLSILDLSNNAGLTGPLPASLVGLGLTVLKLGGTGLCAPQDPAYQTWLATIGDIRVDGCSAAVYPDRVALTTLYGETGGAYWKEAANWLSEAPLRNWYGVETDDEGHVISLDLGYNNLKGRLPQELSLMDRLETLRLIGNGLTGHIPPELARLDRLAALDFSVNLLTGPIPPELGQLDNLSVLDLSANGLTGSVPTELGRLDRLTVLDLGLNRLHGPLPPELGNLRSLERLTLSSNEFTGPVPNELAGLAALSVLNLSVNGLTGPVPTELGQLRNLVALDLARNGLTGPVPPELGQLASLEELDLSTNALTGPVPSELGRLSNLEELNLSTNGLAGPVPPELGQLTNLVTLRLASNRLSGPVPSELGALGMLRTLSLSHNAELSGPLPRAFLGLDLASLLLAGTGLCATRDIETQTWLQDIDERRVSNCGDVVPRVASAYLTQAVQSLENPVPLVAGKPALLRVFVTNGGMADARRPPVRATFFQNNLPVYTAEIPGGDDRLPDRPEEGDLTASSNAHIPAYVVRPGLEMVIEINPGSLPDSASDAGRRLPPAGRLALEVTEVPPLDLTLVPFLWTWNPDWTLADYAAGLSPNDELFRMTRETLPVGDFQLNVREPVWTSVKSEAKNTISMLIEVFVVRILDGARGHYMAILPASERVGVAVIPGSIGVSAMDGYTIAHELGHNMNLRHAPCGGPAGLDPDYPYVDGTTGAWGYDVLTGSLVTPQNHDLMSYCPPGWISDFHFVKALIYRRSEERPVPAARAASATNLLLWGEVNDLGEIVLHPAFVVEAPPVLPETGGPYRLTGEDETGNTLFALSFGAAEVADGDGSVFAFVLPVRADWLDRLHQIAFFGPEGVKTMDRSGGPAAAIMLDRTSGAVRGILRDWSDQGASPAFARRVLPDGDFEVLVSRGIPDPNPR
ncbi:MAG: Ig-like domain-containing protein [Gemmatimonadetes bacterium]|nr:Ig-like domain-containing protein [Gemmatimonadota bacterium]